MKDNFDLSKFLKESKAIENSNPYFKKINDRETKKMLTESKEEVTEEFDEDFELEDRKMKYGINPEMEELDLDDEFDAKSAYIDHFSDLDLDDELFEAKKKKKEEEVDDVENVEDINVEDTETIEDMPSNDPMEDAAATVTGDSKELINHLMSALDVAKSLENEKLTTQVLNTLKFAIDQSMAV